MAPCRVEVENRSCAAKLRQDRSAAAAPHLARVQASSGVAGRRRWEAACARGARSGRADANRPPRRRRAPAPGVPRAPAPLGCPHACSRPPPARSTRLGLACGTLHGGGFLPACHPPTPAGRRAAARGPRRGSRRARRDAHGAARASRRRPATRAPGVPSGAGADAQPERPAPPGSWPRSGTAGPRARAARPLPDRHPVPVLEAPPPGSRARWCRSSRKRRHPRGEGDRPRARASAS